MRPDHSSVLNKSLLAHRQRKWWQLRSLFQMGTIFQWTILIFFAVTLPLIVTLVYSVKSIQDYTDQSHTTLFQTVRVSESSEALLEYLLKMDRSIRQYQILEDAAIFTVFQGNHNKFTEVVASSSNLVLPVDMQQRYASLIKEESKLYAQILLKQELAIEKLTVDDINSYAALRESLQELVRQSNSQIYIETESLSALATLVRNQVTYSALISVI